MHTLPQQIYELALNSAKELVQDSSLYTPNQLVVMGLGRILSEMSRETGVDPILIVAEAEEDRNFHQIAHQLRGLARRPTVTPYEKAIELLDKVWYYGETNKLHIEIGKFLHEHSENNHVA